MISKRAAAAQTAEPLAGDSEAGVFSARSRLGLLSGLCLFGLEALQGLLLPFLIRDALGTMQAAAWVVLMSSMGLVGLACSAYGQSLVRSISQMQPSFKNHEAGLPLNWPSIAATVRRHQGAILLLAQMGFLWAGHHLVDDLGPDGKWTLGLFFIAQHLRLLAFANFIALNGMRRLGLDKVMQAIASASTLVLSVLALTIKPSMPVLAAVPVLTQGALLIASVWCLRAAPVLSRPVALSGRGEALGLLLLAMAGFLSTNSDVLLASSLLSSQAQFQYGVLARALLIPVAVVGLWAHLKFPLWCAPELPLRAGLSDVARLGIGLFGALLLVTALGYGSLLLLDRAHLLELPTWMVLLMLLNAALSALTAAIGQVLLAKQLHGFVWPTILLAMAAPATAALSAEWFGVHTFVLGYLLSSLAVLLVLWLYIRNSLLRVPLPAA